MPKEVIYDAARMFNIQVGWAADAQVQLSVVTVNDTPLRQLWTTEESGLLGDEECHEPNFTGLFSTLDREGVNRLIRSLRKARDSAYGRDE